MAAFVAFVKETLHDQAFQNTMKSLLPFDGFAHAKMDVHDNEICDLKQLGISIMRMDIDGENYSLGITIQKAEKNVTVFITACKSLQELQKMADAQSFMEKVRSYVEEQLKADAYEQKEICGQDKDHS